MCPIFSILQLKVEVEHAKCLHFAGAQGLHNLCFRAPVLSLISMAYVGFIAKVLISKLSNNQFHYYIM